MTGSNPARPVATRFGRFNGLSGAAAIAACFDADESHDGYWYKVNSPAHDKEGGAFAARLDGILTMLRQHATRA